MIVKAILIWSEAKRLYNNIQCRSLIAWSCTVLYTPSVIGWREVPALLTAGYKTDSTQRMFHCSLQLLSANNTVMEHLRLKKKILSGGGGSTKLILLRQLLLAQNHSEIHYLPADPLTCTSIWPPPKLATFLRGGWESDYVLYREKGLRHYGRFGLAARVWHSWAAAWASERAFKRGMKRNAEWMADSALMEALQSCLTARMAEPQLKLTRGRGTRNMVLEYMTERLKISHVFTGQKKRQCWL